MGRSEVAGMVTARWSDADIQVRAGIKVIGGPDAEPRSVIVRRADGAGPDPTDLLVALDGALEAMHQDGTLTRLSQSRFGGVDMTTPWVNPEGSPRTARPTPIALGDEASPAPSRGRRSTCAHVATA